jgi:hypothetical protein
MTRAGQLEHTINGHVRYRRRTPAIQSQGATSGNPELPWRGRNRSLKTFRERLATTLGNRIKSPIRCDAWWATDYHINWLIGALEWHAKAGPDDHERPRDNRKQVIRGTQEDVDLIIASGKDVILVEAKGHFPFGNKQLASKLKRLSRLCNDKSGGVETGNPDCQVTLHFVLMSVQEPGGIETSDWPTWSKQEIDPYWMCLHATSNLIKVGRSDGNGKADKRGTYWRMRREASPSIP